ncbi:non-ribosomal peptide synthetase [Paenibacillus sp. HW567]|uniref:non-ribosomal peptide synthetase n=1 Tax=Paenibacillus sp. HW567 TaxID=1034769 RepID=UPI000373F224|nr:non-ribosomal peptide synthetase [Paenibacillus sp. HW567]
MSSIDLLNAEILESVKANRLDHKLALKILQQLNSSPAEAEHRTADDIAIIGIACRFPFADTLEQYWDNLLNGVNGITDFPLKRRTDVDPVLRAMTGTPVYSKGSYLEAVDSFDNEYFRLSPKEAEFMDPHQRLMLEVAAEAVEDAGYMGEKIYGTQTGVFIGRDHHSSGLYQQFIDSSNELAMTGNLPSFISGRIAFFFDLTGPNQVIDTACSSGLVALHQGCESLRHKECKMAIVGGISLNLLPLANSSFKIVENNDGKVRPFDKNAQGTTWGEGLSAIIIKPLREALKDKDRIYSVVKGSGVNSDGASNYITAPNPEAQERLLIEVWTKAGIHPETISYIETHGTGTVVGDPIEVKAMKQAFDQYTNKKQFCGIGSVKSNIGHLVGASGMASLLKVILSMKHKQLVPTLHFEEPNPYIPFSQSPFYMVDKALAWEPAQGPRRAGISSFGFSGMNCHVLLEEWPQQEDTQTVQAEPEVPRIFPVSAKTKSGLLELLQRYSQFLQASQHGDYQNLVYTAQLGREHFAHRLAIIAKNSSELRRNIASILLNGVEQLSELIGYYGYFPIRQRAKNNMAQQDLTEATARAAYDAAHRLVQHIAANPAEAADGSLDELAQLYVQGTRVDWTALWAGQAVQTVRVPLYPFARTRHWPSPEPNEGAFPAVPGDLLGECTVKTAGMRIYAAKLSGKEHWLLQEHRIHDLGVWPGVAYLEMAKAASEYYFAGKNVELRQVTLSHMLMCPPEENRIVHTIIHEEPDHVAFTIASRKDSDAENWIIHAQGEMYPQAELKMPLMAPEALIQEMNEENVEVFTPILTEGIQYGPRWKCIRRFYQNGTSAVLHIGLTDGDRGCEEYWLHPALMDTALSFWHLLGQREEAPGRQAFPFYYESIRIFGRMPSSFFSYLRKRETHGNNRETVSYDISLIDESGNVFVEVENYTLKKIPLAPISSHLFYRINWLKSSRPEGKSKVGGTVLLFGNDCRVTRELTRHLEAHNVELIQVARGEVYRKEKDTRYVVGNEATDYLQLFADLQGRSVSRIIHGYALDEGYKPDNFSSLQATQEKSVQSLFFIVKALAQAKYKEQIEMVLLGKYGYEVTGGEKELEPCYAAFFNLGKVVSAEYPNLKCRSIDLDDETGWEAVLEDIAGEQLAYQVAYRGNERFVEELARCAEEESEEPLELQDGGLYLITGGTGGLGLEIARYLSSKNKVTLGLLSRSGLPPRNIELMNEIERSGSQVIICPCDITDGEELEHCLKQLREAHGPVKGIVHAAGIAGSGYLFTKSWSDFTRVTAPKIEGTYLLYSLLQEQPDFFVLFSSVATLEGSPGQGDYAAGNGYLDGFAHFLRRKGVRGLTLNWTAWEETGMALDNGAVEGSGIFRPLKTGEAIRSFGRALQLEQPRMMVADIRFDRLNESVLRNFPLQLSPELRRTGNRSVKPGPVAAAAVQIAVIAKSGAAISETEQAVAQLWAKIFGLAEIDISKNFYELGGDSIMATQMANLLNLDLHQKLSIAEIFEYPTVSELAAYLDQSLPSRNEAPAKAASPESPDAGYDLSKAQHRIWFLQNYDPQTTAYHLPVVKRISEAIDLAVLQQGLDILTRRHSSLRTVIRNVNGTAKQFVVPDRSHVIHFMDYAQEPDQKLASSRRLDELNTTAFELEQNLFRAELHRYGESEYLLYINMHHIISDGWSMGVFFREWMELYGQIQFKRPIQLAPITLQPVDWVEQEKLWIGSGDFQNMERYWMEELAQPLPVLELPTDYDRPHSLAYDGSYIKFTVSAEVTGQLQLLARNRSTTLYMTVLAIYFLFLKKLSQEEDIIVGFPVSGREQQEWENVIGLFMNMVCIRVDFRELGSFGEVLEEVKRKCLKAYANGRYPFNTLVEKLNPERDPSRTPVFSTIFQLYDNVPQDNDRMSLYDLSCICKMDNGQIEVRLEYKTSLFTERTIQNYACYLTHLINQVISDPEDQLRGYELLDTRHQTEIMNAFNPPPVPLNPPDQVYRLFEAQADKNPDHTAMVFEGERISYRELDELSNQLAAFLVQLEQASADPVGVYLGRGIHMIAALLGILKSGRPYVPLDADFPPERIAYMIRHSGIRTVVSEGAFIPKLVELAGDVLKAVIDVTGDSIPAGIADHLSCYKHSEIRKQPIARIRPKTPAELMYIIYTSGSTGTPKGVMVSQTSVLNYLLWSRQQFNLGAQHNMMLVTSISFDISVFEIFGCLSSGATLHIVSPDRLRDPALLLAYIDQNKINFWHSVPALMNQFLLGLSSQVEREVTCLQQFDAVAIGGEAWSPKLAGDIRRSFPHARLYNLYGPTEATIWATCYEAASDLAGKTIVPLGKPIYNNRIYILDKDGNLCGQGIPGEICISGTGVTPGYFRDEETTASVYRTHPFTDQIVYHTGDIGKYSMDGQLEYIARKDGMVKVRGYRIETGEIEHTLYRLEGLKTVAVVAVNEGESNKLICYYTSARDIPVREIQDCLEQNLPVYMIPSRFIRLEALPATSNEKIDRKTLRAMPILKELAEKAEMQLPENDAEEFLLHVWQELLGIENIGTEQNFFDIGGNSHLIVQLQARIEQKYMKRIKVIDLFRCKTIRAMAGYIQGSMQESVQSESTTAKTKDEISDILQLLDEYSEGETSVEEILQKLGE